MTQFTEHDDIRGLLVGYVLGTLEPAEQARITAQLARDAALQRDLDEVRSTIGDAMAGVEPHVPDPSLKARVMDATAATAPRVAEAAPIADAAHDVPVADASPVVDLSQARSRSARRHTWWASARPVFGVAAASIIVVLAWQVVSLRSDVRDRNADLRAAAAKLKAEQARALPDAFGRVAVRQLTSSDALRDSHGALMTMGDNAVLMMRNMPDPGSGHSWQVWTRHANGQVHRVAGSDVASPVMVVPISGIESTKVTEIMLTRESTAPQALPSGSAEADVRIV